MSYVVDLDTQDRFHLSEGFKLRLRLKKQEFGFGVLGAVVYARTYSRIMEGGRQETWPDTVVRVVEGMFTIRKWHYVRNRLKWDNDHWNAIAEEMADAIYNFRFLPAGRHLWAASVEHTYKLGSMSLNNCAFASITTMSRDCAWITDALMLGVGVGYDTFRNEQVFKQPAEAETVYQIPDTREGWAESVRLLIESYENGSETVRFDYSLIRPFGSPIKGFGGYASGHEVLEEGHERIRSYFDKHVAGEFSKTRLICDTVCAIGAFVVAGSTRRSATIALGQAGDEEFLNLKNYDMHPERAQIGWLANNTVSLNEYEDFATLPDIAERVRHNGEPGIANYKNINKYGRYGEKSVDPAIGLNPCAEIPLEDKELCLLVETFPTRCTDASGQFSPEVYYRTLQLATLYASSVTLMPTHNEETNAVIARNHRIGVSMSGIADWTAQHPSNKIITWLDRGYQTVRDTNARLAREAGIPQSIRVTTVKPSGTVSLLAGVSAGMHLPPFSRYLRRVRIGENTPIVPLLEAANIPMEKDVYSANTLVAEFPVDQGKVRGQKEVSVWAKANLVSTLQRFWADNMVSNTLSFDPVREGDQIEDLLTFTVPTIKTISLLPLLDEGSVYEQSPIEQITLEEVKRRQKEIREIDWSKFSGSDGEDSKFCANDQCEI